MNGFLHLLLQRERDAPEQGIVAPRPLSRFEPAFTDAMPAMPETEKAHAMWERTPSHHETAPRPGPDGLPDASHAPLRSEDATPAATPRPASPLVARKAHWHGAPPVPATVRSLDIPPSAKESEWGSASVAVTSTPEGQAMRRDPHETTSHMAPTASNRMQASVPAFDDAKLRIPALPKPDPKLPKEPENLPQTAYATPTRRAIEPAAVAARRERTGMPEKTEAHAIEPSELPVSRRERRQGDLRPVPSPVSQAPAMPRRDTPPAAPAATVHVTIGRVEVRAVTSQPAAPRARAAPQPMSLDEYLGRRNGEHNRGGVR